MESNAVEVIINIPFSSNRLAQISYDVLRVDAEPKRSTVKKDLTVENNILTGKFFGESARQLRVGVNSFFENVKLILQTFEVAGSPVSENYSYY